MDRWPNSYPWYNTITIGNDPQVLMNENFMPRLKIMNNILHMWLCRGLSLKGKVTILKSLTLPILYYAMSVLPIPTEVIEIAENMIIDFIWSQRWPKIKRDVIIQDIHNGGIKVPSFKVMVEANRISWISRLLSNSTGKWKCIFGNIVRPYSLTHLLENNLTDAARNAITTRFYKQILDIWNKHKSLPTGKR